MRSAFDVRRQRILTRAWAAAFLGRLVLTFLRAIFLVYYARMLGCYLFFHTANWVLSPIPFPCLLLTCLRAHGTLSTVPPPGLIRVPNTSGRRNSTSWTLLLSHVDPQDFTGFGFHGRFIRAGSRIPEGDLWPSGKFPAVPILLEFAGADRPGWGHRRPDQVHILWRYDRAAREWRELARSSSVDGQWTWDLQPIARRALLDQAPEEPTARPWAMARDLVMALERNLDQLQTEDRPLLLDAVYNQLAARMAQGAENFASPLARDREFSDGLAASVS